MTATPFGSEIDRLQAVWADRPTTTLFAPLAEALRKRGALEQATAVATAGVAVQPDFLPGRLVMARIYADQGEWESAESELLAAVALDPAHPVVLEALDDVTARRIDSLAIPVAADATPLPEPTPPEPAPALVPAVPAPVLRRDAPAAASGASGGAAPGEVADNADGADDTDLTDEADGADFADDEMLSVSDSEPVLTESLAMLYRGQGHLAEAVDVLEALVARAPDNATLVARRDAVRAELELGRPRPYSAIASGGVPVRVWLAGIANSRAAAPAPASSFDAFYQAPAAPPSNAGDLAAFQAWLHELGR